MPMYTYHCSKCDTRQEQMLSIPYRDEAYCIECGFPVTRLVDAPGMVWSPTKSGGNHS